MTSEVLHRRYNILAISLLSFGAAQVLHELTHLAAALLLGFDVLGFHLFGVNIDFGAAPTSYWRIIVVEGSAALVNILVCLVAIMVFSRVKSGYKKLAALLTAGFQGMLGFGYLLFDGLFYAPDAAGDWKTDSPKAGCLGLRLCAGASCYFILDATTPPSHRISTPVR